MKMNKLLISLVIASLACGVKTSLPYSQNTPEVIPSHDVVFTSTSEPILNQYVVTAETLRIRNGAGESFPLLGYLENGQIVTCSSIDPAEDGGQWCKHEKGYSNIRYMKGLK